VSLTPRQLAQKRYQQSAKGKAALARHRAKKAQDAAWRAAQVERAVRWDAANPERRRALRQAWAEGPRGRAWALKLPLESPVALIEAADLLKQLEREIPT
jgi:hypothetical protein